MPTEIRMPKLSDTMEEGIIVRWLKSPGDAVQEGDPLAEVETDKANVELEASGSGVLSEIRVPKGQGAAVGAVIAILGEAGTAGDSEPAPKQASPGAAAETEDAPPPPAPKASATPAVPPPARKAAPTPAAAAPRAARETPTPVRSVRASPLAWRLAEDRGVDLNGVTGSGPGGRIVKRDIEAAMAKGGANDAEPAAKASPPVAAPAEPAPSPAAAAPPAERTEELSRMRRAIAQRMAEAKRDIPHFYVGAEIDMTEAMRLRQTIKQAEVIEGLTVTHVLIRAVAVALGRHPRVNASFVDGKIAFHADANIGIAVALPDGLIVPVLHRAQQLSLGEIAAAAARLTEKARAGKFSGEDLAGATFSISNVGMLDVDELVAVITPPQAAILGVGAVKERPLVRGGAVVVGQTMRAMLSCDHRVVNGVEGAQFLAELKELLESPVLLLLP